MIVDLLNTDAAFVVAVVVDAVTVAGFAGRVVAAADCSYKQPPVPVENHTGNRIDPPVQCPALWGGV